MLKSVFILGLIRFFCLDFGDNYVKMKILPHSQETEMFARDSSFCRYKTYADIRQGSRARRR